MQCGEIPKGNTTSSMILGVRELTEGLKSRMTTAQIFFLQSDPNWVQVRFSLTHTNSFELYRSLLLWV